MASRFSIRSLATTLILSSMRLMAQTESFREGVLTCPFNDRALTTLPGNTRHEAINPESSTCNSTEGNGLASTCVFYDVTQGDAGVNCTGTSGCYRPAGTYGVLSSSTTTYSKAYGAATGYDSATGLGTLNAYNLVTKWTSVTP